MATVTVGGFDAYRDAITNLGSAAAEDMGRATLRYIDEHTPGWHGDIPAFREYLIEQAGIIAERYGAMAARITLDRFNESMELHGVDFHGTELADVGMESIRNTIRYQLRWVTGGQMDVDQLMAELGKAVSYQVARSSDGTVVRNVRACNERGAGPTSDLLTSHASAWARSRDTTQRRRMREVRFARVLTSPEPCTFCTMLASRGFVYKSAKTAGACRHRNCRCRLEPGIQGETVIPGYDPTALKDLWEEFERIDREESYGARKTLKVEVIDRWMRSGMLRTTADPAAGFYGALLETDPPLMDMILNGLENHGVEIRIHDEEVLGYSLPFVPGSPGQFHIWRGASYSAILHEVTHFWQHHDAGYPSYYEIMKDNISRVTWETEAYNQEIKLAESLGNNELVKMLQVLRDKEVSTYGG